MEGGGTKPQEYPSGENWQGTHGNVDAGLGEGRAAEDINYRKEK